MAEENYYQQTKEDLFDSFETDEEGLSESKAKRRLEEHGKNELKAKLEVPLWLLFLSQFKELLTIVLIVGGLTSYFIGNIRDGTIIFIIVLVNAVIGFIHEYRASEIVDKLKNLISSPSKVIRDGELLEISQDKLVPGDIVKVEEGDKIPADLRLFEASNLKTNDTALTGESVPQEKSTDRLEEDVSMADRNNMAYAGTTVAAGTGTGIVVATGMDTETGKIAGMTEEEGETRTPLQRELRRLANQLTIVVVIISVALFGLGMVQDFTIYMSLVYALGVAMAMVPQALPAQVTVALSTGSNFLAKKNAVVKSLPSVETLGSTTVICTDKTGTLTKNEMTVQSVWFDDQEFEVTGSGYEPEGDILNEEGEPVAEERLDELENIMDTATMSSNAEIHEPDEEHPNWYSIGDPTEAALVALSTKLGTRSETEDQENPEVQEFSFDSEYNRMSSVREFEEGLKLTTKGSTESILDVSSHIYRDGQKVELTEEEKEEIMEVTEKYSKKGMRVLAIACRSLDSTKEEFEREAVEKDLTLLGLMAMIDPPKEGVKEAISEAQKAHIRVNILTGDHPDTALAIGRQVGLVESEEEANVITGTELEDIEQDELEELLRENESIIFSRVDPEDKLNIVKTLEDQGEVVAVTGDGVNDAPALKRAHIGVAMGEKGTDVAKEASELILLDDNFSTLVHAVRGGRTIYDNLKKTVLASLTTNVGELTLVLFGLLGAAIANYPIPILAAQILAIDLLGEIGPLTLLTYDPPSENTMTRPPRDLAEHMLNIFSASEVTSLGILIGGLAFANFFVFMFREGITLTMGSVDAVPYLIATSLSYATVVFAQYVNILERRYQLQTLFSKNFFSNKYVLTSIAISVGLVAVALYGPYISDFFAFGSMRLVDWYFVLISTGVFLFAFEGFKAVKRFRKS